MHWQRFFYRFYSTELRSIASVTKLTESASNIRIQGWAHKVHRKGKWLFVHVRDGLSTDSVQVVVPREKCSTIMVGSAVDIIGDWVPSEGPQQEMELFASKCSVVGNNSRGIVDGGADVLRKALHTRPKSSNFASILRLRSRLAILSHKFFEDEGFVYIDAPAVSRNDCEGAGEAFIIKAQNDEDFFGFKNAFLPVSAQLHLESIASSVPKVYTIGAAFRAEKSLSRQHLAEFRMLEAEIAFINSVDLLCDIVEKYVRYVVHSLRDDSSSCTDFGKIRQTFGEVDSEIPLLTTSLESKFVRITYDEAVDLLLSKGHSVTRGFTKQHEMALVKHFDSPVFVTHFPTAQKPFYMKRSEDGQYAECFDLLAPFVGELAGGSVRETDPSLLRSRGCGAPLNWYVDLREYGHPPTAGFGVGIERFMQSLFGIVNIKDTVAFPRWFKHCQC